MSSLFDVTILYVQNWTSKGYLKRKKAIPKLYQEVFKWTFLKSECYCDISTENVVADENIMKDNWVLLCRFRSRDL